MDRVWCFLSQFGGRLLLGLDSHFWCRFAIRKSILPVWILWDLGIFRAKRSLVERNLYAVDLSLFLTETYVRVCWCHEMQLAKITVMFIKNSITSRTLVL